MSTSTVIRFYLWVVFILVVLLAPIFSYAQSETSDDRIVTLSSPINLAEKNVSDVVTVNITRKNGTGGRITYELDSTVATPDTPSADPDQLPTSLITDAAGLVLFSDGRFAPATDGSGQNVRYTYVLTDRTGQVSTNLDPESGTGQNSDPTATTPRRSGFVALFWQSVKRAVSNLFLRPHVVIPSELVDFSKLINDTNEVSASVRSITEYKPLTGVFYSSTDVAALSIMPDPEMECLNLDVADYGFTYQLNFVARDSATGETKDLFIKESLCGQGGSVSNFITDVSKHLEAEYGFVPFSSDEILNRVYFTNDRTIILVSKVTDGNGAIVHDWDFRESLRLSPGQQLQLSWYAAQYEQCRVDFNDNKGYAKTRHITDMMLVGDTELEDFDLTEVAGPYLVECKRETTDGSYTIDRAELNVVYQ